MVLPRTRQACKAVSGAVLIFAKLCERLRTLKGEHLLALDGKENHRRTIIGFQWAARVTDTLICCGPPDAISQGEPSVVIGFKDSARYGDPTVHGGKLVSGCPTVIIGSSAQAETLKTDKPFCEECERKRKEREARLMRKRGKSD